jgi:hypothetical protein
VDRVAARAAAVKMPTDCRFGQARLESDDANCSIHNSMEEDETDLGHPRYTHPRHRAVCTDEMTSVLKFLCQQTCLLISLLPCPHDQTELHCIWSFRAYLYIDKTQPWSKCSAYLRVLTLPSDCPCSHVIIRLTEQDVLAAGQGYENL